MKRAHLRDTGTLAFSRWINRESENWSHNQGKCCPYSFWSQKITCSPRSIFLILEDHLFSSFFLPDLGRLPVLRVLSSWSQKITCSPQSFFLISDDYLFSTFFLLDLGRTPVLRVLSSCFQKITCSLRSFFLISEDHLFSTSLLPDLEILLVLCVLSSWFWKIICSPQSFSLISEDQAFSGFFLPDLWNFRGLCTLLRQWSLVISIAIFSVIPQKVTSPLVSPPPPLFLSRYTESSGAEGDIVRPRAGKYLYCSILCRSPEKNLPPNIRICHSYFSSLA